MATRKHGKVLLQVSLSEEVYQILRKMAFDEEVTVNQMVVKIVEKQVKKQE